MARLSEILFGLAIVGIGLLVAYGVMQIEGGPGYSRIGPKAFPTLVLTGLLVIGVGIVVGAFLTSDHKPLPRIDWVPLASAIGGMVAVILALEYGGGFPLATSFLVALTARAFGSRRLLLDLVIGYALGLACLLVFNVALGVTLPRGFLEGLF